MWLLGVPFHEGLIPLLECLAAALLTGRGGRGLSIVHGQLGEGTEEDRLSLVNGDGLGQVPKDDE